MDEPLLIVEDRFYISGQGTVIEPSPLPEVVGADNRVGMVHTAQVRLVRPDQTEETVQANFSWAHFNPGGYRFICLLPGVKKEQVPSGTQVWRL